MDGKENRSRTAYFQWLRVAADWWLRKSRIPILEW